VIAAVALCAFFCSAEVPVANKPAAGDVALRDGLAAVHALDMERAVPLLRRAVDDTSLPGAARARAALGLGQALFSLGDDVAGRAAFARAVHLDPGATLSDDVSPRLRQILEAERRRLPTSAPTAQAPTPASASRVKRDEEGRVIIERSGADHDEDDLTPWLLAAGGAGLVVVGLASAGAAVAVDSWLGAPPPGTSRDAVFDALNLGRALAVTALVMAPVGTGIAAAGLYGLEPQNQRSAGGGP
jgi:hypothetical protein